MSHVSVIAGLGNPGPRYAGTRHNIGFLVLEAFAESCEGGSWSSKEDSRQGTVRVDGEQVHLIEPLTFMNRSGEPIGRLLRFYKCETENLLVVHDDVDLPFGVIRLKLGGGEGGHNGLRSTSQVLGSKDYYRLRIGVGRPPVRLTEDAVAQYVLSRFSKEEEDELSRLLKRAVDAIFVLLRQGLAAAQRTFHPDVGPNAGASVNGDDGEEGHK